MILIIGSTGMVGQEICKLLSKKGKDVLAMVRESSKKEKVDSLNQLGVKTFIGDIKNPATYIEHLRGVSTIITTLSSMPFSYIPGENDINSVDKVGMINLIDNAKNAGVDHFIYTSFSENINIEFPLNEAKRNVEGHLKNSGMKYTILRPSYFTEVWLSPAVGFDVLGNKVQIFGDGSKPISYISLYDVAQFAVESIDNPYAINKTLELGGPEKISQLDALHIFEDIAGKKVDVESIPVEALKAQREVADDPMQKSFSGLMENAAMGDEIDMTENLNHFSLKLRPVKYFAQEIFEVNKK